MHQYEVWLLYDDKDKFVGFIKKLINFFSGDYIYFLKTSELENEDKTYAGLKPGDVKHDFRLIYDFKVEKEEFEAMDPAYIHGVSDKRIYYGGEAFIKALSFNDMLGRTLANWYVENLNLKKFIDNYIYENTVAKKR